MLGIRNLAFDSLHSCRSVQIRQSSNNEKPAIEAGFLICRLGARAQINYEKQNPDWHFLQLLD